MNADVFLQELTEHFRTVLGGKLGAPVRMAETTVPAEMWTVRATCAAGLQITFAFDSTGAAELARVISGQDEAADQVITSTLGGLCKEIDLPEAAKLAGLEDPLGTVEFADARLIAWSSDAHAAATSITSATLPATLIVAFAASGDAIVERKEPPADEFADATNEVTPAERLDVLLDIDLPMVVRFGCTQLPLKTVSRLGPGSLIDLSRAPDDPVELLVGERIVARGEVVVVSGSYGIRVLEVVGGRDAARSMGV